MQPCINLLKGCEERPLIEADSGMWLLGQVTLAEINKAYTSERIEGAAKTRVTFKQATLSIVLYGRTDEWINDVFKGVSSNRRSS